MVTDVITQQVLILGLVGLIGFIGARRRIITEPEKETLVRVVVHITLPLMIFHTFATTELTGERLTSGASVLFLAWFCLLFMLMAGWFSARLLKLKPATASIHTLHTAFGNHVFLGFPLLNALFPGGEGVFYATLFYLASSSLLWTVGVLIISDVKNIRLRDTLRPLMNQNTLAFFLGFGWMLSGWQLPGIISASFGGLGSTTNFLAMLYIGALLADTSITKRAFSREILVLSLHKLLLLPIVLMFITRFLLNLFSVTVSPIAHTVVVMQTAMPCMVVVVLLAKKYHADTGMATENVFITTLLSLLSLPAVYALTGIVN